MVEWKQVSDDSVLIENERTLLFDFPGGEYAVVLKPSSQELLTIRFCESEELWPIMTKAIKGTDNKFSGLADWVPEILGEVCWYELILGETCSMTYWGDQVIYRTDHAKT